MNPKRQRGGTPITRHRRPISARSDRRRRACGLAALLLSTAGCVSTTPHADLAAPGPRFAPEMFFAGRTVGDGVLRIAMSHARQVHVEGDGRTSPDGALTLVQHVEQQGKPARVRQWRLRFRNDGHLDVTLSDAVGPVMADVMANRLHIRFATKGGLGVEQWIYLQSDGRTAINRMVVRKFGIPVAALRETIRKVG